MEPTQSHSMARDSELFCELGMHRNDLLEKLGE